MKKTLEILPAMLLSRRNSARNIRVILTLLLALLLWTRPGMAAIAGCTVYFLLSGLAGAALLRALCRYPYAGLAAVSTIVLASLTVAVLFPRRDQLGAIGIGLYVIFLGCEHLNRRRLTGRRPAERMLYAFELLLHFLLGGTFLWCCKGSFFLAAPLYAVALTVLALQRVRLALPPAIVNVFTGLKPAPHRRQRDVGL